MVFQISALTVAVMALLGGVCAYLANRSVAVFSDGLRPVFPQYLSGTMDRRGLFATSFALSFGLVIGFGLPTSLTGGIIVIHTIMLSCDIIGTAFPDRGVYPWAAAAVGGLLGVLLLFGMEGILYVFAAMPVNFLGSLSAVGSLIVVTFCAFPAMAVAYQSGFRAGTAVFALTMLVRQVTAVYGSFAVGGIAVSLNVDGTTLLFAIAAMVISAMAHNKKTEGRATAAFAVFGKNVARIRAHMLLLAVSGGLAALATTLLLVAEGPASLALTAEGRYGEAAIVALGRCLGFIPLVMTTAIISGLYSPAGTKTLHVPAILLINTGLWGLVGSFMVGALIMVMEVLLLGLFAKGLDRFPGMKEMGDNTRAAMSKVLELALLLGGCLAADAIAPTLGYLWIFGLYFLNQSAKKPVPAMAIGPIGAILLGVLVNLLHPLGLFPVPS